MWFAAGGGIGRITPDGEITEYPIPTPGSSAADIAVGPDGNMWFPALGGIARITPDGEITEYPILLFQTPDSGLRDIAVGPDGNMWFTAATITNFGSRDWIAKITPSGEITEYGLPTPDGELHGIALGGDGNIWFTEGGMYSRMEDARSGVTINKIGRITPDGVITEYQIPTPDSVPYDIAAGPDGNMWFTAGGGIAKITPDGAITEYPFPPSPFVNPHIAVGPDGNLLLFEIVLGRGKIARITPDGAIAEYLIIQGSTNLRDIAAGPDGSLWLTEGYPNANITLAREYPGDSIKKITTCQLQTGPSCGNGASEAGESCDDGNKANLDGCTAMCIVEIGWTCSGSPSRCAMISQWQVPQT